MSGQESVRHVLGVAIRIDDHFTGEAIRDELDVRIDGDVLPTQVRGGTGRRHSDGTYRFLDLADRSHQLTVRSPDARWVLLDPLPAIVTPVPQPTRALVIEAWPTPLQSTPPGMTSVRGKLVGPPAAAIARRVELDVGGVDSGHRARSTSLGELLFLLPGRLALDAAGLVALALRVVGGTPVTVTGGEIVDGETITSFAGSAFKVAPGRETRVRFHVT